METFYNWYALYYSRGIAPDGTYISSNKEWQAFITIVSGESVVFTKITSSTGFSIHACGHLYLKDCSFNIAGVIEFWSSTTKEDRYNVWSPPLHFCYEQLGCDNGRMNTGMSIRCIVD